ncbi:SIMPL domain-containing protein [Salipiger sp. P9]|uniref:SIMPL domain-containing protein n=1 Tax=Salipiger pentaromativorans TaxID=2943193 RepID=UPI0021573D96|nr:SIMPL domain-containing protein [Salipiger pentaromativorans]MCR8546698.1 SIMPL domain-containing protein [Salipiger pentaromativorans]
MRRLVLAAACALMVTPVAALAEDLVPKLTVTGDGRAAAVPDMATVTLGVTAEHKEPGAAMNEASRVAGAILARLDALGIAARDRQTSDIGLQPVWTDYNSNRAREITGYVANNRLTVRVRDLARLGEVLGAVTEDGANRLSGLSFGLQEPGPVMDDARRDAVADAMAQARVLAEAAGVGLGAVLSISEAGGGYAPEPMMEMARVSSVPVAAGESVLTARVTMVFALEE